MTSRIINFSAGPSVLPREVILRARDELPDWEGSGQSVMEMSHRGSEFCRIGAAAEQDLRDLMGIPDNYRVLFLQGGATAQFAMVPLNLLAGKKTASYVNTGSWSGKAMREAVRWCEVRTAASSEDCSFTSIPDPEGWSIDAGSAYLHYTTNETIGGVEFPFVPDSAGIPLVADMSSNILSRPVDVSRFGVIYAGAQKNMGIAGITVVIVRDNLIGHALDITPSTLDYRCHADQGSMLNTPPAFSWYIMGLVFQWLIQQGGVAAIEQRNQQKADALYNAIDRSPFYSNPVDPRYRSRMNVPFTLADPELEKDFLAQAGAAGMVSLKGHRSVGGMRASIYNAMPLDSVHTLIDFMQDFERRCA